MGQLMPEAQGFPPQVLSAVRICTAVLLVFVVFLLGIIAIG